MRQILLCMTFFLVTAYAKHELDEFQIEGLSKQAVIEKLGDPRSEFEIDGKRLNDHMGPKPKLARLMADDDTVEVWRYSVTDNRAAAVYFDETGKVAEVVISRTDVMY